MISSGLLRTSVRNAKLLIKLDFYSQILAKNSLLKSPNGNS